MPDRSGPDHPTADQLAEKVRYPLDRLQGQITRLVVKMPEETQASYLAQTDEALAALSELVARLAAAETAREQAEKERDRLQANYDEAQELLSGFAPGGETSKPETALFPVEHRGQSGESGPGEASCDTLPAWASAKLAAAEADRDRLAAALEDEIPMLDQAVTRLREMLTGWEAMGEERTPDGEPAIEEMIRALIDDLDPAMAREALNPGDADG